MKKKPLMNEIHSETFERENKKLIRTSVILEADAFYAAKEMALKRKRDGVEPSTLTGILSEALREFIKKERNI
jgi:hypothetical protein